MPGIVGFASANGFVQSEATSLVQRMRRLITHETYYLTPPPFSGSNLAVAVAHVNAWYGRGKEATEGDVRLWLDGEWYPVGATDEQARYLLDRYLQERSLDFLREVDGQFAGVLHDAATKKMFLFTDRLGLRPLYWIRRGDQLLFASELKAFLADPDFPRTVSEEAVAQFLEFGHMLGDTTWFQGVSLMPRAGVLEIDLKSGIQSIRSYWSFADVQDLPPGTSFEEVRDELARRIVGSILSRVAPGQKVGLPLSGGLDSRAILAALLENKVDTTAYTFGRQHSFDVSVATRLARRARVPHRLFILKQQNWIERRVEGVWRADAAACLLNMHGIGIAAVQASEVDVSLSGYLGDAIPGGSYLDDARWSLEQKFEHRGRRMIWSGVTIPGSYLPVRVPLVSNEVLEWTMAIPEDWRRGSRIYSAALSTRFRELFAWWPIERSGLPMSVPAVLHRAGAVILNLSPRYQLRRKYADYARWIRIEPGKSFFADMLCGDEPLYSAYIDPRRVRADLDRHYSGEDHSTALGRYVTMEMWLRQVENVSPDIHL